MSHLRKVEEWLAGQLQTQQAVKKALSDTSNTRAPDAAPYPRLVFTLMPGQRVGKTLCGAVESIRANYEVTVIGKDCGYPALESVEDAIHVLLDHAVVKATAACPAFDSTLSSEIRRMRKAAADNATLYEVGGVFQFFVTP